MKSVLTHHRTRTHAHVLFTAKLDVNSFGSALDTTLWSTTGSATGSQAYKADQVSTSSNQLKLAITPCTASPCGGYNFTAGGITTKSNLYGFGVYTARFKAPSTVGFTAQMEVPPTPISFSFSFSFFFPFVAHFPSAS